MNIDFISQPGSKWRAEEDAKLIELVVHGKNWLKIIDDMLGRIERSCFAHYRQTLAHKLLTSRKAMRSFRTYIQ